MSGSDTEETFVRKHKQTIRRAASFNRIQSLPQLVDDWFQGDASLHQQWDQFVAANKHRSTSFQTQIREKPSAILESDHGATAVHTEFCDTFEKSLNDFLCSKGFTSDEFQEAFRLSKDEEERKGANFFRWPEIVEFRTFTCLMLGGSQALVTEVRRLSDDARNEYRRRVNIFPTLAIWAPLTFQEVERALTDATEFFDLRLSRPDLREHVRWRAKLCQKALDSNGVYVDPQRNETEWSRYISFVTKNLTAEEFDLVLTKLKHVSQQTTDDSQERQLRRCLLDCFDALDDRHHGNLVLAEAIEIVGRSEIVENKTLRKLSAKWRHCLNQRRLDAAQLPPDGKANNEADDVEQRMDMSTSLAFLEEIAAVGHQLGAAGKCDKLRVLARFARDR